MTTVLQRLSQTRSSRQSITRVSQKKSLRYIQDDSGGEVCILAGYNIGHCETEGHMHICLIPNGYRDRAV